MRKLKRLSRREIIMIAAVCLAVILAIVTLLAVHAKTSKTNSKAESGIVWDENAEEGEITQRSAAEVQRELNEKVEAGMINISMNTSPVFANGETEGNLLIANSERNNYPQVVYIVRKDTGDEIYRSGAIPVGSKIEYAKLVVPLDAGTYECVAYFNNVDPVSGGILGTAGAEIVITVEG